MYFRFSFCTFHIERGSYNHNIDVFEDLVIWQICLHKKSSRWSDLLAIRWVDLKTKILMPSIQTYTVDIRRTFDRCQYIFLGFGFWHL